MKYILLIAFVACVSSVVGFIVPITTTRSHTSNHRSHVQVPVQADPNNFLWDEFRTYRGEVVDPYKILKVHRTAERQEIRQQYINLSKRYHPDVVRHKTILPGNCNDLEDVRDQWERIKLSYEILSDKRLRKRYDRHEVIADPMAAMQRAAVDAGGNAVKGVGQGLFNVGKGLFSMGAKAVAESIKKNHEKEETQQS